MSKKIALFSGSFNPIHIGHVAIANYVVSFTDIDEVWLIVSPQNPLKQTSTLVDFSHRIAMAKLAVEGLGLPIIVSDIENSLPKPSYTINTLDYIHKQYPDIEVSLLIGSDNILGFERWRNWEQIIMKSRLLVYPRNGYNASGLYNKYGAQEISAPLIEVSSTFIRQSINKGINVNAFISPKVSQYIKDNKLYST